MKFLLAALAFLALPALAAAQAPPVNPVGVAFDSPDHARAIRYEIGYFIGTATSPFQTQLVPVASVGGTPAAGLTALFSRPAFGNFTVKVKLVALSATNAEVASAWSDATVPFVFSPLAPTVRGLQ